MAGGFRLTTSSEFHVRYLAGRGKSQEASCRRARERKRFVLFAYLVSVIGRAFVDMKPKISAP